jgi:hypothetical protein
MVNPIRVATCSRLWFSRSEVVHETRHISSGTEPDGVQTKAAELDAASLAPIDSSVARPGLLKRVATVPAQTAAVGKQLFNGFGMCCKSTVDHPGCGSIRSHAVFAFGSCHGWFGEGCEQDPYHSWTPQRPLAEEWKQTGAVERRYP